MRYKSLFIIILLLVCFSLCACGDKNKVNENASTSVTASELSPVASPEPTLEPTVNILGKDVPVSELENGYTFELFGQTVNTKDTTELHYEEVEIGDSGLMQLRQILPYMNNLTYLTFDRCGTTDETVAQLREDFPDKNIAWRVFFDPFSCMTDTEKIWASCDLRDEVTEPLRYCNKVKYMDIGHNAIHDLWFLEYMPDLEVLIISCGEIEDITPLKYCKNLKFLECAETYIKDCSVIAELENLEYLNVGQNNSLDPDYIPTLYTLKHLKRFFIGNYFCYEIDLSAEEKKVQKLMPNCEVNFHEAYDVGCLNGSWRFKRGPKSGGYTEMYEWIREIFEYDNPYGQSKLYVGIE